MSYFLACTFGYTLGAKDLSFAVSGFGQSMLKVSSKEFLTDIVVGCSGVTYPYSMGQDNLSIRPFLVRG